MTVIDGPLMLTVTGRYINPLFPWEWEPDIGEIAWHLSQINRFCGATSTPYNVADHSVRVCELVPDEQKLAALLHDASEAYMGDWPSYLKHHPMVGAGYRSVESALQRRIDEFYGVNTDHDLIHWADRRMLATERRDLLPKDDAEWLILRGVKPEAGRVIPRSAPLARAAFTARFEALRAGLEYGVAA